MGLIFISNKPLVLASGSPRRQEYFRQLGLDFTISTADMDESAQPEELPDHYVLRMARSKAQIIMSRFPGCWVVAADTIVSMGKEIIGKPSSAHEAYEILRALSAQTHKVRTTVCLGCLQENIEEVLTAETKVTFTSLSKDVITNYVASGEPFDKAGAYGIQGLGAFLVTDISGSYSNVVGLPLTQTLSLLMKYKVIIPAPGNQVIGKD